MWATNGRLLLLSQCKKGMPIAEAEKLLDKLVKEETDFFKVLAIPVLIQVTVEIDRGAPKGPAKLLQPRLED